MPLGDPTTGWAVTLVQAASVKSVQLWMRYDHPGMHGQPRTICPVDGVWIELSHRRDWLFKGSVPQRYSAQSVAPSSSLSRVAVPLVFPK